MNKSFEIHTIRFGDADWLQRCAPTLDAYCARHDVKLRIWGKEDINPAYPCAKFCEVDMLREFLAGDADRLFYIDADIWIHPFAPLPDLGPGFHVLPDPPGRIPLQWPGWCKEKFGEKPYGWIYRNAGVWICDRESAQKMLDVIREPYHEGIQDQHHWNWWMWQASRKPHKMRVHNLGSEWNRIKRHDPGVGWLHHAAGRHKMEKLDRMLALVEIPETGEPPLELEATQVKQAVCWPWKRNPDEDGDLELSVQSVLTHFVDKECPLVILGEEKPDWFPEDHPRLRFVKAPSYAEALTRGVQYAERILWMNDDIGLVRQCDWSTFSRSRHQRLVIPLKEAQSWHKLNRPWTKASGRIAITLYSMGYQKVADYRTHSPYLFEREKAMKTLRQFGVWNKIPFELAYFNQWARDPQPDVNWLGKKPQAYPGQHVITWTGRARTPEMMDYVRKVLPKPVFDSVIPA